MAVQMTNFPSKRMLTEKVDSNEGYRARQFEAAVRVFLLRDDGTEIPVVQYRTGGVVGLAAVHEIVEADILVLNAVAPVEIMHYVCNQSQEQVHKVTSAEVPHTLRQLNPAFDKRSPCQRMQRFQVFRRDDTDNTIDLAPGSIGSNTDLQGRSEPLTDLFTHIELRNLAPILEFKPLQGKEEGQEARQVREEVDAGGLDGSLTIVPPNAEDRV